MKVLLVSSGSGSRGGGEIFLDYLGSALADRGHEIVLWLPHHERMNELADKCARFARIIRANYHNTYDYRTRSIATCFNWQVSRRIAREWRALRPDVVHINKQNLEDGLDLLRAARISGLPSVCTVHLTQTADYLGAKFGSFRNVIARWQLRKYDGLFVGVHDARCSELRKFIEQRVEVKTVLNGVPCIDLAPFHSQRNEVRRKLGLAETDLLILGLGRLVEQKRPFVFLRIAEQLSKQLPNARFLWVGDGRVGEQWRRAIARKGLQDVISCAGWQADVRPYLLAGDLLLHVAAFEGLPFAVIEAMAAGLACAVTRDFASEMGLFSRDNILFADDPNDLEDKLRNREELRRVANAGYRLIKERLSVHVMAQSYEKLYNDVVAGRSRRIVAVEAGGS